MRIGAKKRPFYRVVAVDERNKRTGAYLELLGTYNPLTEPKEVKLNQDLIDAWLKKGAQPSDGFLRIIGKAPQKPPRKPKKDQGKAEVTAPAAEAKPEAETSSKADSPETTTGDQTPAETAEAQAETNSKESKSTDNQPPEVEESTPAESAETSAEEESSAPAETEAETKE
jgi:small subunit ribosomal protein S16